MNSQTGFNIKLEVIPNIKNFLKSFISKKYNRICVWKEITADLENPITAYLKLIKKSKNNFLLESVVGGSTRGRYSIIGIESDKIIKCEKLNDRTSHNNCTFKLYNIISHIFLDFIIVLHTN